MQLNRGQRSKLSELSRAHPLRVSVELHGIQVDIACFGLDAQGKLSDERYMQFYNQPQSPCMGVQMQAASHPARFVIDLDKLPAQIDRLVFTAALEGAGTMQQLQQGKVSLGGANSEDASFAFSGNDFSGERAVMLLEIYRKDGIWRVSATGQGFNGGLAALVRHFGGEVAEDQPAAQPAPTPAPSASPSESGVRQVSLEKRVEKEAPHLVNLAKKATVTLAKKGLLDTAARVGLVLDASGSMRHQYASGKIQELLNRLLPLALHFDDDGALDTWAFADKTLALPAATASTIRGYVEGVSGGWKIWMHKIAPCINNEPVALNTVIEHYRNKPNSIPTYIVFVSDGGVSQNKKIQSIITQASSLPIFWQFVGIGGRGYGVLEQLDTMQGRTVDNANFFAIDDLHSISEEELYERLLNEFPQWIKEAAKKGITR
ncbi:MAG: VWA domain-containing protein [Pseudomonadota bacterium]